MEWLPSDVSGTPLDIEEIDQVDQMDSSTIGTMKKGEFLPRWDQLQEVLWEKVSLKLPPSSLATFRAVCKRWKALVVLPLNPTLWKTLPEELLERVVSKVPFGSLVTFRAVSKRWKTFIIPLAVAAAGRRVQSSGTSGLLYFEPHKFDGRFSWWLQICNSRGAWTGPQAEFPMSWSFPTPRQGEIVRVVASDGGLLFFSIVEQESDLVQEYVVCNPLTGKSKSLLAPYRLVPPVGTPFQATMMDVGVVSNIEAGTYKLVAAGLDCTLVYDSLSCTWKATAPMPLEEFETIVPRSVSCNGSLYWCVQLKWPGGGGRATSVLKYDLEDDSWRRFRVDDAFRCDEGAFTHYRFYSRIGLHKGKVLLSHLHQPVYHMQDEARDRDVFCQVWMWESNVRQLGPEMGLMCWNMLEAVEKFLRKPSELAESCYDYLSFGQRNFFYTIMLSHLLNDDGKIEEVMRVLVHNSENNSHSELPVVQRERRSERACFTRSNHYQELQTSFLWAFFPSFNSTP